jgi:thiamine pyrophosphokinase
MNNIQKNAIIFANGEPCSRHLVSRILAQYPDAVKIVLDGAIEHVPKYNFIPDIWLGDFDHTLDESEILKQYPELTIIHTADQEYTDLEKAVLYLQEHTFKTVNIVWATGKRLDHTINNTVNIARFSSVFEKIVLYDDYSVCMPLPKHFEQHFIKDTVISLVPLGIAKGIVTKNLKYPLSNEDLQLGYRNGTSNQVSEDGLMCITYTGGDILLILEKEAYFSCK